MKTKVSISRIVERDNVAHLKERLQEILKPFGGITGIIDNQDRTVLLKPNLVFPLDYKTGATTNPYLIKALVEIIKEKSSVRIIIADGSAVGADTGEAMRKTGYYEILSGEGVELRDLKEEPYIVREVPGGRVLKELRIPELVEEVDRIINLPVLKTHDALFLTLGLKNMKGIIHESDKKRFHRIGLAQAIVDLNKLCRADFTVYDGTVAMEGPGPAYGDPVNLNLVLAARDVVAGDLVAAGIMGFMKEEIEQLVLAEEQGMGMADLAGIEVVGPSIEEVRHPFVRYSLEDNFYNQYGINIRGEQGCSGCRNTLDSVVRKLDEEEIKGLGKRTFYLGPVREVSGEKKNNILIGSCLHQYRDSGEYILGCPPHPGDLLEFLKEKGH